jgi:arylformamidase
VRLAFLNADLRLTPESARRNSPLYLLPPNGAPLLAAVGADETAEFLRQSADYAAAWRAGGHPCRQLVPPGRHHFSILDELADPSGAIFLALREQMQAPGAGGRAG